MRSPSRVVVTHLVRHWLPQTKTWIYEQLRWLPPEIEAHVCCERVENLDQFPFPRLHVLGDSPRWSQTLDHLGKRTRLGALRAAARTSARLGSAVVHSHFGPEAWREMRIARALGAPHVVTFYGYDVTRVPEGSERWRRRYRELFAHVALVLCEGPHMREAVLKLGAAPHIVQVQHLGVDLTRFVFGDRIWGGQGPVRILMAASFREKKGIPFALRAVARAQRARPDLDLRVTLVGDATADADSQREKKLVLEAMAELAPERVQHLGFRPHSELLRLATEHHVVMSPSVRAEDGDTEGGAPVALIELAALGLPLVSTTHCDIPNVLRGPATALLAAERDVDGLSERLLWLLDHPEQAQDIVRFVRSELEERFDAAKQAQGLAALYRELSSRGRRRRRLLRGLAAAQQLIAPVAREPR